MRQGQHNKNRSRNRGGGGRRQQNPVNRVFESNGPDVKIRGNASHVAEKYNSLARDALVSGNTVTAENYFQHAEHYLRILAAAQAFNQQNQQNAVAQAERVDPRQAEQPAAPGLQNQPAASDSVDTPVSADARPKRGRGRKPLPEPEQIKAKAETSEAPAESPKQEAADVEAKPAKAVKPAKPARKKRAANGKGEEAPAPEAAAAEKTAEDTADSESDEVAANA